MGFMAGGGAVIFLAVAGRSAKGWVRAARAAAVSRALFTLTGGQRGFSRGSLAVCHGVGFRDGSACQNCDVTAGKPRAEGVAAETMPTARPLFLLNSRGSSARGFPNVIIIPGLATPVQDATCGAGRGLRRKATTRAIMGFGPSYSCISFSRLSTSNPAVSASRLT